MKRVFIVHGWGGSPEEGWFPWLAKQVEDKKIEVHVLPMPETNEPSMEQWIPFLAEAVGNCDEETFFVGHSIGCQTILRYMESLSSTVKAGGVVLVAPWVHLKPVCISTPEEQAIAKPWLETPMHWENIRSHSDHFEAIFSDNDDCVYVDDAKIFEKDLQASIQILHAMGHFSGGDDVTELPEARDALFKMMDI